MLKEEKEQKPDKRTENTIKISIFKEKCLLEFKVIARNSTFLLALYF